MGFYDLYFGTLASGLEPLTETMRQGTGRQRSLSTPCTVPEPTRRRGGVPGAESDKYSIGRGPPAVGWALTGDYKAVIDALQTMPKDNLGDWEASRAAGDSGLAGVRRGPRGTVVPHSRAGSFQCLAPLVPGERLGSWPWLAGAGIGVGLDRAGSTEVF